LVQEFDSRLTAVMHETGDSWDIRASSGDLKNWIPGGGKQRGQSGLGADWPGKAVDNSAPVKQGKGKRSRQRP
jgi:hypothetical protein